MFPALSLVTLALASGSDGEESSEKAWFERFEAIDQARKGLNIPPLSKKERMALLLGQGPICTTFVLNVCQSRDPTSYDEAMHRSEFNYDISLARWEKDPVYPASTTWFLKPMRTEYCITDALRKVREYSQDLNLKFLWCEPHDLPPPPYISAYE
jgi:hypothetical protein